LTKDGQDINTPAAFTQGDSRLQNTSLRAEWFWKRATGGESGMLNVTKTAGSGLIFARMYRYAGVVTTGTPYENAAQTGKGASNLLAPIDISTAGPDRRVIVLVAEGNNYALGDFTGGTATVPEETAEATSAIGTKGALGINGLGRSSAGQFDFGSYTLPAASGLHIEFSFALRSS
jgi:hypothetical protein